MDSDAIRIVAVLGPTASGKSALGMALAERLGGEIVTCDSQQVYIGMDIGTAKPTRDERRRVPHHGLDLCHPDEPFHAARWAALARAACKSIAGRGRLPIVVGGTGLYYRALTAGLFEAPPPDPALRARHRAIYESEGNEPLRARLLTVDPEAAAAIQPRDFVRTSRALEVYEQTGIAITTLRRRAAPPRDLRPTVLLLDPSQDELRARIEGRVETMLAAGFLAEVRALRAAGYGGGLKPMQALGYQQLGAVVDGNATLADATTETVRATVAYARRQRTWFKREPATARFARVPPLEAALAAISGGTPAAEGPHEEAGG
ncbi:MAG TPA: tRNA (adenosine(37)-N6)-dimethylallyltransferase MiaA [Polyangia bacterium]|nr:tRNA (adenosine(37)-N6)-dimethylallyltransferase MiaA [Polyangia bacterium]